MSAAAAVLDLFLLAYLVGLLWVLIAFLVRWLWILWRQRGS